MIGHTNKQTVRLHYFVCVIDRYDLKSFKMSIVGGGEISRKKTTLIVSSMVKLKLERIIHLVVLSSLDCLV